jgi:dipeptidyl aminopeptidase/acylaminoacyl peptidase
MTKDLAPYGSWRSPITATSIAQGSISLSGPVLTEDGLWWLEGRPVEGGRQVIVHDGHDAIPEGFNARTRVHEYGGGAYLVDRGRVFFSNDDDGRIYRIDPGGEPVAVSPEPEEPRSLRYADFAASPDGERIWCVRESHQAGGDEAVNEIVWLAADGDGDGEPQVVASGHDFYAAPRLSPDGRRLAWLSWDHPRMPWDGTELWTAAPDGSGAEQVTGGPEESVEQPGWSPDGRLHWVSDRSGWWNLYREGEPLHPAEAEFGMPIWVFGESSYTFLDDGRIACVWSSLGFPHLGLLDPATGRLQELEPEFEPLLWSLSIDSDGRRLAYVGASPTRAPAVVVLDPADGELTVARGSVDEEPDPDYVSVARPIEYESHGRTAHALFYPPCNRDYDGPADERPPLLVMSHGGPTAQTEPALDLTIQYFTSRGIAVADVNYGGSTGYGRAYRELLRGQWGIVDVEDCAEAALYLARKGDVDGNRLAIRGGSAGGYTTLAALVFTDTFDAGASYYGVADIDALMADTHKFESRYDTALVPPGKGPERSPINFVDRISAPVIVLQGLEDPVVPPQQAELIVAALRDRGIEHEYRTYEGEAHGFRTAETIVDALEAELKFYGRVLGFEPSV